jgi:hypothetical protein
VPKSESSAAREKPLAHTGVRPDLSGNPAIARPAKTKDPGELDLIPFKEALNLVPGGEKKHLMLGNGFSIALRREIFTYNTLLERAHQSNRLSKELDDVFTTLGTTDFEKVIEALENAADLVSQYEKSNPNLAERLRKDAVRLRDVLAETIAENHPARPHDIDQAQYASCRRFLANFDGGIYTLNYDLLLYWTLMQSELAPSLDSDDGFRDPEDEDRNYVVWDVQNTNAQRIFYLHGALHIYDAQAELLKFTWSKTDIALVDQIKSSLAQRRYPLIVTEGTSEQKKDRIQHSNYLGRGYRSFSSIGGSLFIYGHSLADNDEHLLKLIDHGKIKRLFVGIYGDSTTDGNRKIIERARMVPDRRVGARAEVHFYDAASANVWDGQGFDSKKQLTPARGRKAEHSSS